MELAAHITRLVIICLLALVFLLFGWRDFLMLFRRPTARLGTGLSRIWAVARVTVLESWAARVWVLILLDFAASGILLLTIRPFDEADRIPEYIRILLLTQEIILLIGFWVLSCTSLPKEREKKLLVTNATKPVSRFELMLGKITGFSVASALMLAVMGAGSYVMLVVANHNLQSRAQAEYARAESDYRTKVVKPGEAAPPPPQPGLKALAEEGSLYAYNYITPRRGGFSVVGKLDLSTSPPTRYLKGGSEETAVYIIPGGIILPPGAQYLPQATRPTFVFRYDVDQESPNADPIPKLHVTIARVLKPMDAEDVTLNLLAKNGGETRWAPDDPEKFFSEYDPSTGSMVDAGPVEVRVACPTPGYLLKILDGVYPDANGKYTAPANVYFGSLEALPNPVVEGFQRRGSQQIGGPDYSQFARGDEQQRLECGVFHFVGEDLKNVPLNPDGTFTVSLFFDIDKEKNEDRDTEASVVAVSMAAPSDEVVQHVTVIEKRKTDVNLPQTLLGSSDPSKRADLYIRVYCYTPGHWLGALDTSARIESPPTPFVINLAKSELTLFAEILLWVVVCVVCSVRLDWPLAMMASFCVYCLGHIAAFVAELPEYGGLAALNLSPYGDHGATWRFIDSVMMYVWQSLNVMVHLMPDFTRYSADAFITDLRNRPWIAVGTDLGVSCIYALPFLILGYMLFRKQELG